MRTFGAAVALTGLCMCAVGWLATHAAPNTVAAAVAVGFLPYGLLLALPLSHRPDPAAGARPLPLALLVAGAAGTYMALSPSPLSDDVFRYLWDGRQWLAGNDAYALPPSDPRLSDMRDAAYTQINHRDIPTVYPPLAELLFALCTLLSPSVHTLKLLAVAAHLGTAVLVERIAANAGSPPFAQRAGVLLALNPLLLTEAALGGHIDACVGLSVAAFVLALQSGRTRMAAAMALAAAGLKLLGAALAPLLWPHRRQLTGLTLLACLACAWPPMHAGYGRAHTASGLSHYTQRWRGNEGPFRALEALASPLIPLLATDVGRPGHPQLGPDEVRLAWLRPWVQLSGPSVFAEERKAPRDRTLFERRQLRFMLARVLAGLLLLGVTFHCIRTALPPLRAARAVLWTLLLTAPQLHPWYLAWLLPLDLALGRRAALLWSATVLVSYAPLGGWQAARVWALPTWAHVFMHAPVLLALLIEQVREAKAEPHVGLR